MTQWSDDLVARVASAARRQRITKGLSAAALSERTAALGHPISRAVISDFETGRKRGLEVAELVVIARALDVPPIQLL